MTARLSPPPNILREVFERTCGIALLLNMEIELADEFEVSISTISRWSTGRSKPMHVVMRLVSARIYELVNERFQQQKESMHKDQDWIQS